MRIICIIIILLSLIGCHVQSFPDDQKDILKVLYNRYDQWEGTPYKLGGYDKDGIDCSGFVALTFTEEFNVTLPRSTIQQAQMKGDILKDNILTGDLVFFKIPQQKKYYHVGIYLENNLFLHASTSKGVIISDLSDNYWESNYWKSIRLFNN